MASRSYARWAVVLAGALMVCAWWWWPALSGAGDETRVALLLGGDVEVARVPLERRLREEGLRTMWLGEPESWCDLERYTAEMPSSVEVVVISAPEARGCEVDIGEITARRRVVALTSTFVRAASADGVTVRTLRSEGVLTVDADRLLAPPGQPTDCLWWDDCPASGSIVVVDNDGLNLVGGERIARLLVAAVVE